MGPRGNSGWGCVIFALALVSAGAPAVASSRLSADTLTVDTLIKEMTAQGTSSKADFLQLLPQECRQFYTLVYKSRATPCSSFESPRVITTCSRKNSRLVIAINGERPGVGPEECNRTDILATSLTTGKIETTEINFQPSAKREVPFEVLRHPARCAACHGDEPKYLADQYPLWPGFYESELKYLEVGSTEWAGLKRYQALQSASPVYRQLVPFEEKPAIGTDDMKVAISLRLPSDGRPFDEFFFNELRSHNDIRVGTLFRDHPDFARFGFALLGAALGCQPLVDFFPPPLTAQGESWEAARQAIVAGSKTAVGREEDTVQELNAPAATGLRFDLPTLKGMVDRAASTFFVAERMGLDPHAFVTSIYRDEVKFPVPAFLPLRLLFDPRVTPAVANPILESLRAYLQSHASDIVTGPLVLTGDLAVCRDLAARSRQALSHAAPVATPPPAPGAWPFAKCAECHRTAMAPVVEAPPIPFDDVSGFAMWLRAHGDFRDKIRARISANDKTRMPPNQALSPEEKAAILKFVSGR